MRSDWILTIWIAWLPGAAGTTRISSRTSQRRAAILSDKQQQPGCPPNAWSRATRWSQCRGLSGRSGVGLS
eukprot:5851150-Pyramimonas_sp.AAC.1